MKATTKKLIKQQVVYIPTKDLARAQKFYADVFEFDLNTFTYMEDLTGEKWSIFPLTKTNKRGETIPTGFFFLGLGHSPHLIPSEKGTLPFLPCEDMDKTLQKIESFGGKVIQGKTLERKSSMRDNKEKVEIYHAFFLDTEGNKIGLIYGVIETINLANNLKPPLK